MIPILVHFGRLDSPVANESPFTTLDLASSTAFHLTCTKVPETWKKGEEKALAGMLKSGKDDWDSHSYWFQWVFEKFLGKQLELFNGEDWWKFKCGKCTT